MMKILLIVGLVYLLSRQFTLTSTSEDNERIRIKKNADQKNPQDSFTEYEEID